MPDSHIDLHGFRLSCSAPDEELLHQLVRPFRFFRCDAAGRPADTTVRIHAEPPPYDSFPPLPASFSSPRNIIYRNASAKIIDYFGTGVVMTYEDRPEIDVYGESPNFLMEAFYLLVLSLFGQHCDRSGLMRLHAVAVTYRDTAFLIPVPPGGGKSTIALSLLEDPEIRLMSDDEPIINQQGQVMPFPLRIGTLNKKILESVPKEFVYEIDRMEFGPKHFIDCACWQDQLETRTINRSVLVLCQRVLNGDVSIQPAPKRQALKSLIRDAVVGIGIYQGVEFLFSHSSLEALRQSWVCQRRFRIALKLLRRSSVVRATLSNDVAANAAELKRFIKGHGD